MKLDNPRPHTDTRHGCFDSFAVRLFVLGDQINVFAQPIIGADNIARWKIGVVRFIGHRDAATCAGKNRQVAVG